MLAGSARSTMGSGVGLAASESVLDAGYSGTFTASQLLPAVC
jgi:hypothetical protein